MELRESKRSYLRLGHIAFWAGDYQSAYQYYMEGAKLAYMEKELSIFKLFIRYAYLSLVLSRLGDVPLRDFSSRIRSLDASFRDDAMRTISVELKRWDEDFNKLVTRIISDVMSDVEENELDKMKKRYKQEVADKKLSCITSSMLKKQYFENKRFFNFLKIGDVCIVRSYIRELVDLDLNKVKDDIKRNYRSSYVKLVSPIILEAKIGNITFIVRNDGSFEAEGSATDEFENIVREFARKCIDASLF